MAKKIVQQEEKEKITSERDKLSLHEIKEIITMIRRNGILEFDLEQGGMHLKVLTNRESAEAVSSQPVVIHSMPPPMYSQHPQMHQMMPQMNEQRIERTSEEEVKSAKPAISSEEEDLSNLIEIKSPMVGTFYRAPAPDAPSYVEVGDFISKDSVLCIVEAMKLMNELKSEVSGTVKKILVKNAQPVEYGQTLFLVDPS